MKKLILLAIALCIILSGAAYTLAAPAPTPSLRVILREATGSVTVTSGADARTGAAGMDIKEGDTITTGPDGEASVEFFDGSRLGIDNDSSVVIRLSSVGDRNWRDQDVSIETVHGRVWVRVLKFLDKDSSFEVRHSDVVALVRGTAFLFTTSATEVRTDTFDGSVHSLKNGQRDEDVPSGFTQHVSLVVATLPAPGSWLEPTPDDVRNDHWVREQLKKDEEFAARAVAARQTYLGATNPLVSLGQAIRTALGQPAIVSAPPDAFRTAGIGDEAGPFTLGQPGVQHSNFQGIRIEAPRTISDGTRLRALAYFSDGSPEKEVTSLATWQVSDPSVATIERNGTLRSAAGGEMTLVARWNDGTHEHSGTASFRVVSGTNGAAAVLDATVETSAELFINGKKVE